MESVKIKVYVEDAKSKEGRPFKSYKAITKNGRKVTCKFTKECKQVPTENSIITVTEGQADLDTRGEFPVLWVRGVEDITPMADIKKEASAKKLAEWF